MKFLFWLLPTIFFTVIGLTVIQIVTETYPLLPKLAWLSIALGSLVVMQQGVIHYLGRSHKRTVQNIRDEQSELIRKGQEAWEEHAALVRRQSEELSDKNWELQKLEDLRCALKNDTDNIEKAVKVFDLGIRHEALDSPAPYVEFGCQVFNGSLFPISVGREIEGFIEFGPAIGAGMRLSGQISLSTLSTCEFRRCLTQNVFHLRQELTPAEAEMIKSDPNSHNAHYKFYHLKVMIRTEHPNVQIRPLSFGYGSVRRDEPHVR